MPGGKRANQTTLNMLTSLPSPLAEPRDMQMLYHFTSNVLLVRGGWAGARRRVRPGSARRSIPGADVRPRVGRRIPAHHVFGHETPVQLGHLAAVGTVCLDRLPLRAVHRRLVVLDVVEPHLDAALKGHSALGVLGCDRRRPMVLHVAAHAGVLEREGAVIGSPPLADLLAVEIPAEGQQKDDFDHALVSRVVEARSPRSAIRRSRLARTVTRSASEILYDFRYLAGWRAAPRRLIRRD